VLLPIDRFLHVEAASGIVLLAAAIIALVWANVSDTYERTWHMIVTLGVGGWVFRQPVEFWINDGVMVLFFFVVGLEIRREIHDGELSRLRRAALPLGAALGGMVVPALLFVLLNRGLPSARGWGVPMATDIAFAIGVLALLGKRVPPALRVLLLALAIIDDIGGIVVIALFYSPGLQMAGLGLMAAGVAAVLLLQRAGVRAAVVYVAPGIVLWLGCLRAGIHPTIAGVILGLLTPARAWFGERGFLRAVASAVDDFRGQAERAGHRTEDLLGSLAGIKEAQREAIAPVVRLQTALHPWVAFVVMPLFALANAGVVLRASDSTSAELRPVMMGAVVGLVLGKPLGIVGVSFLFVRLRLATLPRGVTWRGVGLVGVVGGIGFTMAIFIAELAFSDPPTLQAAKLAVLVASALAGVIAVVYGRAVLPATPPTPHDDARNAPLDGDPHLAASDDLSQLSP